MNRNSDEKNGKKVRPKKSPLRKSGKKGSKKSGRNTKTSAGFY